MKRKPAGVLLAFTFAVIGTLLLVAYVQSAKNRAGASEKTVDVLVVDKPIPKGTDTAAVNTFLLIKRLPAGAVAPGALTSLDAVAGKRTSVDLLPGEQLLQSRFITQAQTVEAAVGAGNVEVTVSLSPERAAGGRVRVGDRVDVITSFKGISDKPDAPQAPEATKILLANVKVTAVQMSNAPAPAAAGTPEQPRAATTGPTQAPSGTILVTLAVTPADAERVVFATEFGTMYLAGNGVPAIPGSKLVTKENVYK